MPADKDNILIHVLSDGTFVEDVSPKPQKIEVSELYLLDESRRIIAIKAPYEKGYLKKVMISMGCKEVSNREAATAYFAMQTDEMFENCRGVRKTIH